MNNSDVSFLPTSTVVRPHRIALLIPASVTKGWICDHVITWMSCVWGGESSFIFPIYNKEKKDKTFSNWLGLLNQYDPDIVISLGKFKKETISCIYNETRLQESPIVSPHIINVKAPGRGLKFISSLENVLSECELKKSYVFDDYKSTGSKIHDLWFFSQYGKIGKFSKEIVKKDNIEVLHKIITKDDVFKIEDDIFDRGFFNFDNSPAFHSRSFLGSITSNGYFSAYSEPNVIVIGNSIADWALFQNIKSMTPFATWIPNQLIRKSNSKISWGGLNSKLFKELYNPAHQKHVVTSATLDNRKLDKIIKSSQGYNRKETAFFNIDYRMDFKKILDSKTVNCEQGNMQRETLIVSGDNSLDKIPVVLPKSFKLTENNSRIVNDFYIDNYLMLTHEYTKSIHAGWNDGQYASRDEMKMNSLGGISFNPINNIYFSGSEMSNNTKKPFYKRIGFLDSVNSIFKHKRMNIKESVGTFNIKSALRIFNNSLECFMEDYVEKDTSKIFNAYKNGNLNNESKRHNAGVTKEYGITIRKKAYFSYPINEKFSDPLLFFNDEKLDNFLKRKVLLRGHKLTCTNCGFVGFYEDSHVGYDFKCKRCYSVEKCNQLTLGMIEPRFLYGLNPVLQGIQDSDSDYVLKAVSLLKRKCRVSLEYETEILVYNEGELRHFQEIDIVASVDGKLLIGECKKSNEISPSQIKKYASLCEIINAPYMYFYSDVDFSEARKKTIRSYFNSNDVTKVIFNYDLLRE